MKKVILSIILILVLVGSGLSYFYQRNLERAVFIGSLFTGVEQFENLNRLAEIYPVSTMIASPRPFEFKDGSLIELPNSFWYKDSQIDVQTFLSETDTSSLLVLEDGEIRFETYMLTGGRYVNWMSMSVAKSFIATGIGIAVDENLIDIYLPITDYVPSLLGSAYDSVQIKDILQMSSGATWNENYNDPNSDVMRLARIMAIGGSMDEFVATLERGAKPGTLNHYNSTDTQALGMLLARATGKSVSEYLTEKVWHPLGMESDGYWLVDDHNVELAFGGLNATARDYAKLGELYRLNGAWIGKQIVSEKWIQEATTPDAPHVMPGVNEDYPLGYGYQWWIPESSEREFLAIGVYNQFIYVNPTRKMVIVKLSAFSDYATSLDESAYREIETIAFFREVAKQL